QNEDKNSVKDETTDSHSDADSLLSPVTPTRQEPMEVENEVTEIPELPAEKPLPKNPANWTVLDVYEFIKALPGCTDYADEFRTQEIDGQAFLLLKEDHLMSAMNMKLGPALKMCACINSLKETRY
uniref:SAM domain-containing protein n=1 Tax=Strigamia maritima TaxID=126957 RepID=T1JLF1_STRMM